jgi:hypothetical protein
MSDLATAKAMCDKCDISKEVDEMLADLRELALEDRDFKTLRQIRRVRRRPALKAKVEAKVKESATAALVASNRISEFGDGEFARWLVEWFSEEGWQIILQFIKGLIALF